MPRESQTVSFVPRTPFLQLTQRRSPQKRLHYQKLVQSAKTMTSTSVREFNILLLLQRKCTLAIKLMYIFKTWYMEIIEAEGRLC